MKCLINQPMSGLRHNRIFLGVSGLILACFVLGSVVNCASVPHTGRRQLNLVSDRQLNQLGLKAYKEVVLKQPFSSNERLKSIAKRVADRITNVAESMDKPGFDWKLKVIDRDIPNAFCLPGGKIVIFEGIVKHAKNEAGLAAIIGHEVAHAVARHGGERLSQKFALDAVLSLGSELFRKGKDGKLSTRARFILGALGAGGMLGVVLPYNRIHEYEADRIGQIYMARAGYDPVEAIRLWSRMAKIKQPPIPEWLSTHPPNSDRIRKLRDFLPDAKKYYEEARVKYGRGSLI
jgi:predicted Zn-dependent protease